MPIRISIVVTSYSASKIDDYYELLLSIKGQAYSMIQVIYVIEGSMELLNALKNFVLENNIKNVKFIFYTEKLGLSAARNVGIMQAEGEIIAFIDDDVVLFPKWAENLEKSYYDDSVIGVTGPALPLWEDSSMNWLPKELYWIVSCTGWFDCEDAREVRNVWGHNMSFKAEAFKKCGLLLKDTGFSLSTGKLGTIGEDLAFSIVVKKKTGKRLLYNPAVKAWHRVYRQRLSWSSITKRAYWIGYSRYLVKLMNKKELESDDILSAESNLLTQILIRLYPAIIKDFFTHPILAWKRFSITSVVLLFVAVGYTNLSAIKL